MKRFIYDTVRSAAMIDAMHELPLDAVAVCRMAKLDDRMPRQYTLELTPHRPANGPLTPQHHVTFDRGPIAPGDAKRIIDDIAKIDDAVLMLGGLGDALEHDQWQQIVTAAGDAGVFGIGVETDLLVDQSAIDALLKLPIDVVSVRINADSAATYDKLMREGGFKQVLENMQYLLQQRAAREQRFCLPWVVPRLIKTADTLKDMETFFERWMTFTGHAMVDPAVTGVGLMPDYAPLDMAPPRRRACRQIFDRVTIHADGRVARCDQDWLARAAAGRVNGTALREIWQDAQPVRDAHRAGKWQQLELCSQCREWHRG